MSLKDLRQRSGLTQKEAANVFGLKYRTYQNYELGNTSPDMDTAAEFARYFKCTIGELFDLEEGDGEQIGGPDRELLNLFNSMSKDGQKALMATAKGLAETFPLEKESGVC